MQLITKCSRSSETCSLGVGGGGVGGEVGHDRLPCGDLNKLVGYCLDSDFRSGSFFSSSLFLDVGF